MQKIKILHIVSAIKNCGPINIVYGIIKGLDRERFEVTVISLSKNTQDSSLQKFKDLKVNLIELNLSRMAGLILNKRKIDKMISDNRFDLVHSHGIRADLINSRLGFVTRFCTIHNFPKEDYTFRYGKFFGYLISKLHLSAIKKIPIAVACSQSLAKRMMEYEKIQFYFVANGIDVDHYSSRENDHRKLRADLNLPLNKVIFTVSGGFNKVKNPEVIIESFKKDPVKNGLLLFLGSLGSQNALSVNHPNILFYGQSNQVSKILKTSDYFVSASYSEGMPNSVLEAISSGVPVILSNIPAHREIVGKNYPYLFDPSNEKELLEKIQKIVEDDNQNLIDHLMKRIVAHFSIQSMSAGYQALYLKNCKGNQNTRS